MSVMAEVVNGVLLLAVGLVLWLLIRGRLEAIDHRIDRLEDSLTSRIDGLRSDLTQVALAVGARPPAEADN